MSGSWLLPAVASISPNSPTASTRRGGRSPVHHAISELTAKAAAAADLDPDQVSFAKALRLIRRTATGTAEKPGEPAGLRHFAPATITIRGLGPRPTA